MAKKNKAQRIKKNQAANAVSIAFDSLFEAIALRNAVDRVDQDGYVLMNVADEKMQQAIQAVDFAKDYFNQKAA